MRKFCILGAGSWGTALAILLARNGCEVKLWGRNESSISEMGRTHYNERYLPGIVLPASITFFSDLSHAVFDATDIIFAVPSVSFRQVLSDVLDCRHTLFNIIIATKGFDPQSNLLLHQVVNKIFICDYPTAILSGPSFAKEVAKGLPTAVTIASDIPAFAKELSIYFLSSVFRPYLSHDSVGVEVAGGIKNIIAIAAGISDGLGYGANARSALITRGLAEIVRLGIALGGKLMTFLGLAGMGDLVLTCTDNQSRNRRFGLAIGQGSTILAAQSTINQVIEGYNNVKQALEIAKNYSVEMPISEQIFKILYENISPKEAVNALMTRAMKEEFL